MSIYVGIDIGSRSSVMSWRQDGRTTGMWTIEQTAKGHKAAAKKLRGLKPALIVLEATGIYYLDLATALSQAGLPVSVINPKSFHNFAKLKLVTSKTDSIDAQLLAEYAERMTPRLWVAPTVEQLALRDLGRQINRLTRDRTRAKNRLHALESKGMTFRLLIEDEEDEIAWLERRVTRLKEAALEQISQNSELASQFDCMLAAPGIGASSAIITLAELATLPKTMKSAQVSRHAGLDVRQTQSGTSINKPGRMSKAGNGYLRAAMYMPVLSAIRSSPQVKAFYESLVARGKKKMQAIGAVMRKYLTGIWACIRAGEHFDPAKLFSEIHFTKT